MARKRKRKDPFAAREAEKYEHPVPSREFIMQTLEEAGTPLSGDRLEALHGVEDPRDADAFRRRLSAMVRDGQMIRNRRGDYVLVDKTNLIRGRVTGHPDGFGFLIPDEPGDDVYLPPRQMRLLLHGDRAVVSVTGVDRRGRREGAVVEVLERAHQEVVGRFFIEGGVSFVEASNRRISQDIQVPPEHRCGAAHGQIVVVGILEQPHKHAPPIGKVVEVVGDHMAPGMEIDIAMRVHDMPLEWPEAVHDQIAELAEEVPESAKQGREDLRDTPLVTIDGEDARDFDDAVFCERHGKGWRLLVAIADVSAYVHAGSALDGEAHERGNSVYFPDRVIPMLPEVLSNGLCSLNPEVDRLCLVCEMFISASGRVSKYRFFDGVMRSHARLTYNKVAAMLVEGDKKLRREHKKLVPHLDELYALFKVLRGRRDKRGAIDFSTTETRIMFDDQGKIDRIVPVERNEAHMLIEECMVAANVAAAEFLLEKEIAALYRVHEGPGGEALTDLREFLGELGLSLGGGANPEPGHYAKILASVKDRPDRHLIETVLLRSLSRAVYSPDNIGHFGLAYAAYTHFTSPIRRYPDLLVHRAIRHLLSGTEPAKFRYGHDQLNLLGEHCAMTERRADEATRDAVDWLKCEYMMDRVGDEYEGIITSVTSFGLFVELNEIYVEGLVHVTALHNDYYHHDPVKHRMTGEHSGVSYRLADPIRVKVARVDLDDRKIDFVLADSQPVREKRDVAAKPERKVRRGKGGKKKTAKKKAAHAKAGSKRGKGGRGKTGAGKAHGGRRRR